MGRNTGGVDCFQACGICEQVAGYRHSSQPGKDWGYLQMLFLRGGRGARDLDALSFFVEASWPPIYPIDVL